jgi:hypothetical protein
VAFYYLNPGSMQAFIDFEDNSGYLQAHFQLQGEVRCQGSFIQAMVDIVDLS